MQRLPKKMYLCAVLLAAIALAPADSIAQITFERIASGLSFPVDVRYAPGDPDRLFIVLLGGEIRIYDLANRVLKPIPFITVPNVMVGAERGLLGLAFHPDYQSNGLFYVNFTDDSGGDTRITQFSRVTADLADPDSGVKLLEIDQPQANHNGGWLGFGPDGYLYIATGESGVGDNAQDLTHNLLGKMLRIDVNRDDFPREPERNYGIPADNPFVGDDGDDEIFMYGLRNPWRCSFDRETGDLWIGDVGAGTVEEVTFHAAQSPGGQNYGWPYREGTRGFQPPGGSIDPIFDYLQGGGLNDGFSITGGYVYRGPLKGLRGNYFFSDYISGRIRSFQFDGTPNEEDFYGFNYHSYKNWLQQTNYAFKQMIRNPAAFGEDLQGNLYVCDLLGGEVYVLVDVVTQPPETFLVSAGTLVSGGLLELTDSDNAKVAVRSMTAPVCGIEVEGTSPTSTPGLMSFTLEASTRSSVAGVSQVIEFFNFETDKFEIIDVRDASILGDKETTVSATGPLARFVETGTNRIRAKMTVRRDRLTRGIHGFFDQAFWTIVRAGQ